MPNLTKSKLMAYRQCPKRLWLEIHKPEVRDDSGAQMAFAAGNQVGAAARSYFDPKQKGTFIDIHALGHSEAIRYSTELLAKGEGPVFEAGLFAAGALAYADVMLPSRWDGKAHWRMIEVKSSTKVHDHYRDDLAIQAFIASEAGVSLASTSIAYIDNGFTYTRNDYYGEMGYSGLFKVLDLTEETTERFDEVKEWITRAQKIAQQPVEPEVETGKHCTKPYACSFCAYCNRDKAVPDFPLSSLPRLHHKRRAVIEHAGIDDLRNVPDAMLNVLQQRVKECSASGIPYYDAEGATAALRNHTYPAYFLDFETISFAVPIWLMTQPYSKLPFQYSIHTVHPDGEMQHDGFLDLAGLDPSQDCAIQLIKDCGVQGPIFAYNAGFESGVIRELAERFPDLAPKLQGIIERIVDLLPVVRNHYYHPSQHGSWSIKVVLPVLCPELSYDSLDGVNNGGMAQEAFLEAINLATTAERKQQIQEQLNAYCKLDTFAMVRIWQVFKGIPATQDL